MSSKKPARASETSDADVAGAASTSSVTTNEPHDVSNVSVQVFSGSSRSVGCVAPPSSRGAGASTSAQSPGGALACVVPSEAAVSVEESEPPQPAARSASARTGRTTARGTHRG